MKWVKKILIVLLVVLVVIQFFKPKENKASGVQVNDIATVYPVSDDVNKIFKKACNDCHSNNTVYPWYSKIQPVAWWLNEHVEDGKNEFNMNEFATFKLRKQYRRIGQVAELVKKEEMPLKAYTLVHRDAVLTDAEKETLYNWSKLIQDSMKAKYPMDSLIRKK